jgi:hypothetical protein
MCTVVLILPTVLIGVLLPLVVLLLAVLRVVEAVLKHSVVPKLVLGPPLPLYLQPRQSIYYPAHAYIYSVLFSPLMCL